MPKSGFFLPIPCRTLTIRAVGGDVQECRHIASPLAPDEHPVLPLQQQRKGLRTGECPSQEKALVRLCVITDVSTVTYLPIFT